MSVVIVGGNECMERRYTELCGKYHSKAKVFTKMRGGIKNIGNPDLLILFTNTVSHKLVHCALNCVAPDTVIVRSHTSSMQALKNILEEYSGNHLCQENA